MSFIVAKNTEESIKVLYPCQGDRKTLLENEMAVLKRLNRIFHDHPVDNGIARFIEGGFAVWKKDESEDRLPGDCTVVVYTYGKPLFPLLRRCIQKNDRKMLYWYFSQMAKIMSSIEFEGRTFHNNIGPNVFRLTSNKTVFVDNFEIARYLSAEQSKFIHVAKNGFPIGFKPTMSDLAMHAQNRTSYSQFYSFMLTSYYILYDRLPWEMDAIDYLWNFNMKEARKITLELQRFELEDYFKWRKTWKPVHSEILSVITEYGPKYILMSNQFKSMSNSVDYQASNLLYEAFPAIN